MINSHFSVETANNQQTTLFFFLQEDGDLKVEPYPDRSDEQEVEWEDGWEDQIQSLAGCFRANGPYSACPNMAKGRLIDSKEVWSFLA